MKYLCLCFLMLSACDQTTVSIPGPQGVSGPQGSPGSSGVNGSNGTNGTNSIVSEVAPCGENSSPWKEQLLCLDNGTILASFSDSASGLNTRFANIGTGSYDDTDSSGCQFSVVVATDGSTTVSWDHGSNQYSTWTSGTYTCQAGSVS